MIRKRMSREPLSIASIGQKTFWIGLLTGISTVITLAYFFAQSRESLRLISGIQADLLVLTPEEVRFYDYFYSALASSLGLSVSIWIWMSSTPAHRHRRLWVYKRFIQTGSLLLFWIILLVLARFGTIVSILPYGLRGFDDHLNLKEEYWLLFVLLPPVVFFQNWSGVRLIYRTGYWIICSGILCTVLTLALAHLTSADQEIINHSYYARYETEYRYIIEELENARTRYGLIVDEPTKEVLKKWYAESAAEQRETLKSAFAKDRKVPMDTIILQKIVQYVLKPGDWYNYPRHTLESWPYALPADIYRQIRQYGPDAPETRELFVLLKDQIDLWNTPALDWTQPTQHTHYDVKRTFVVENWYPYEVAVQLNMVRDSLLSDNNYIQHHFLLPEINDQRSGKTSTLWNK